MGFEEHLKYHKDLTRVRRAWMIPGSMSKGTEVSQSTEWLEEILVPCRLLGAVVCVGGKAGPWGGCTCVLPAAWPSSLVIWHGTP